MSEILAISAHPDDMEIGMGGTIAKLADTGHRITSVVLTDGRRSSNPFNWSQDEMARIRKEEAINAAKILGVEDVIFFELHDLTTESNYQLAKERLNNLIIQLKPSEVYTLHERLDRHKTHKLAGRLTRETVLHVGSVHIEVLWAYEVWGLFRKWDKIVYIDDYVGKKLRAIREHKSQIAAIPYPDVIGLNGWRGSFGDIEAEKPEGTHAEVFVTLEREINQ